MNWRFVVGGIAFTVAMVIHTQVLMYIDLTLLAANSATSIVAAIVLSTKILGEVFILRYDGPALFFICLSSALLISCANKTEQKTYDA